jgi:hypothetical protein
MTWIVAKHRLAGALSKVTVTVFGLVPLGLVTAVIRRPGFVPGLVPVETVSLIVLGLRKSTRSPALGVGHAPL